ncbi:unnamed protein product [Staurois parvus]|uniref:Uncharacterized protein n=1 Tax=Staurois parvus TaxID=386267 RepID=A0ABN9AEC4_9NEOB|nr:unnamed protein product [Staurois parvus]
MISVAQQCHLSVSINASCQCPSMPPASAHQCHISVPHQCHISVPISDACQCPSLPPTSASSSVQPH